MLAGGIIVALVYGLEAGFFNRFINKGVKAAIFILPVMIMISCVQNGPEPIVLNKDNCAFCKMSISDGHFGAELVTKKGRILKFDDISCLMGFKEENPDKEAQRHYVHYFLGNNELIPAESAFYIKGGTIKSPMSGNIAAFKTEAEAIEFMAKLHAEKREWNSLNQ